MRRMPPVIACEHTKATEVGTANLQFALRARVGRIAHTHFVYTVASPQLEASLHSFTVSQLALCETKFNFRSQPRFVAFYHT